MTEKRLFERFDIHVPVKMEIPDRQEIQGPVTIETNNLSAGGIFFQTDRTLPAGAHVKMEITLRFDELKTDEDPDGSFIIAVTGYVQRSGPAGTAICFHNDYDVSTAPDFLETGEKAAHITG